MLIYRWARVGSLQGQQPSRLPGGDPRHHTRPAMRAEGRARTERLRQAHDGQKKRRRPRLDLLARGQAHRRQVVVRRLGVQRQTMRRWLAPDVAAGTPVSLAPPGSPAWRRGSPGLQAAPPLRRGARGYGGRPGWQSRTRRSPLGGARASRPSVKGRGPRPPTPPAAMPPFQAPGQAHRQHALPPPHLRPRRVGSQDARRVGFLTVRRQRLTARGVQPLGPGPHVVDGGDGDGAGEPRTGARFFLALPSLHAELGQRGLAAGAEACAARRPRLRLDPRGAHPAARLGLPATGRLVFWPPAGPERTPLERVWRDRKEAVAWLHFAPLEGHPDAVAERLRTSAHTTRHARTGSPALLEAIHAR
jgi:hypothetical protein